MSVRFLGCVNESGMIYPECGWQHSMAMVLDCINMKKEAEQEPGIHDSLLPDWIRDS